MQETLLQTQGKYEHLVAEIKKILFQYNFDVLLIIKYINHNLLSVTLILFFRKT